MHYNVKGEKIYISSPTPHKHSILNIHQLGETLPSPDFKAVHQPEADPAHSMYTFEYITKGRLLITQGKKTFTAGEGDILILNRTASHYYSTDPKALVGKYFIVCNGTYIDNLMEVFRAREGTLIHHADFSGEFHRLFSVAQNEPRQLSYHAAQLILRMLCAMNPLMHADTAGAPSTAYPLHDQIVNYIKSHISESLRLEQLTSRFSITPITLNRMFKENYGTTPKQFILAAKIDVARQLLTSTDLPVNRIAESLSFGHQNNFANAFSKITGQSPSEYRHSHPMVIRTPDFRDE